MPYRQPDPPAAGAFAGQRSHAPLLFWMTARWAQAALDARWTPLIEAALSWSNGNVPDLDETLGFIDDTRQASER
jgi:hypothetical protein